jgi:hypothetical protein
MQRGFLRTHKVRNADYQCYVKEYFYEKIEQVLIIIAQNDSNSLFEHIVHIFVL